MWRGQPISRNGRRCIDLWPVVPIRRDTGTFDAEEPMAAEAERLARLEGAYNHLATKADLANLETRLTTWFAGVLLLLVINVLGTVTGILIALLG